jgi:hypothetical protein
MESKIRLSPSEKEMVSSAEVILTKNRIIKKAIGLLELVQEEVGLDAYKFISDVFSISPKISKGENYEGLPYAILDFPRMSDKENFCFVRTMFWWGNFFSSTLQVSGSYKKRLERLSREHYGTLKNRNYFINISTDPWIHHFGEDNYKLVSDLSLEEFQKWVMESAFIKIAAKFPLEDWENAATQLSESWRQLISLIAEPVE